MTLLAAPTSSDHARRVEELGRIIMAYSEVTERLQQSHEKMQETVVALREELGEKNRLKRRTERLASIGALAAGMAHEIRNPLGGIHLYASMLAKDVAHMPQSLSTVKKISGGVKRLEALVSQVLAFSRDIQVNPVPADLAQVVAKAIELASPKLDALGTVMDFHELERLVDAITGPMHNRHLNELQPFDRELNPSAENVAFHIARSLHLPGDVRLERVEVWETDENSAVYRV